jgi:transposase
VIGGSGEAFGLGREWLVRGVGSPQPHTSLIYKRLEGGRFSWPQIEDGVMRLSSAQLGALFEGLEWKRMHTRRVARPRVAQ